MNSQNNKSAVFSTCINSREENVQCHYLLTAHMPKGSTFSMRLHFVQCHYLLTAHSSFCPMLSSDDVGNFFTLKSTH